MNPYFYLVPSLVVLLLTCTSSRSKQMNFVPESPVNREILYFSSRIQVLSNPSEDSFGVLYRSIRTVCRWELSVREEFMGYPQYSYKGENVHCIWNQNREIRSFLAFDTIGNIRFTSYWYLGYPTYIEKTFQDGVKLSANWVWIQNHRITVPTIQFIRIQSPKEERFLEYNFHRTTGSLSSKAEWREFKSKKILDSWQMRISDSGAYECVYYEKNFPTKNDSHCSLYSKLLEGRQMFTWTP